MTISLKRFGLAVAVLGLVAGAVGRTDGGSDHLHRSRDGLGRSRLDSLHRGPLGHSLIHRRHDKRH